MMVLAEAPLGIVRTSCIITPLMLTNSWSALRTQAMAAMIALLPGLSHLLLLPNQQPDLAAGTAATLAAGAAGLLPMQQLQRSRLREWQMGEAALR